MERLTEWNDEQTRHAYYPRCFEAPCYGSGCKIENCPFEAAACDRLAAYEDTGLTPEEIKAPFTEDTMINLAAQALGVEADRLRERAEADKDGRVVVLPCKVGDTVWRIKWTFETYPDDSEPYIEPDAFLLQDVFSVGKTVFLTREEAERALAEREGKKNG